MIPTPDEAKGIAECNGWVMVLSLIGMAIVVILPTLIAIGAGLAIGVGAYFVIRAVVMFFLS